MRPLSTSCADHMGSTWARIETWNGKIWEITSDWYQADEQLLKPMVKAGAEKIITKNGESYIALIDAQRLDYYHQLERERIHLLLIDEASKGLDDVAAGKVKDARRAITALKRRRSA